MTCSSDFIIISYNNILIFKTVCRVKSSFWIFTRVYCSPMFFLFYREIVSCLLNSTSSLPEMNSEQMTINILNKINIYSSKCMLNTRRQWHRNKQKALNRDNNLRRVVIVLFPQYPLRKKPKSNKTKLKSNNSPYKYDKIIFFKHPLAPISIHIILQAR